MGILIAMHQYSTTESHGGYNYDIIRYRIKFIMILAPAHKVHTRKHGSKKYMVKNLSVRYLSANTKCTPSPPFSSTHVLGHYSQQPSTTPDNKDSQKHMSKSPYISKHPHKPTTPRPRILFFTCSECRCCRTRAVHCWVPQVPYYYSKAEVKTR